MLKLHRVAREFYGRPLLITPDAAHTISNFLLTRMGGAGEFEAASGGGGEHDYGESREYFAGHKRADGSVEVHTPRASRFYGEYPLAEDGTRRPLPFRRTAEGVAIITAVGEWVNRGGYVGAYSGVISYEGFKYQLSMAAQDPRTKAILLDLESPGGQAIGAFEAADAVRAAAAVKPVWAVVNGMAASAAYAIASAATKIITMTTGLSGSIGVVMLHLDFSAYLKEEGVKPTFIFAGDHKVDANPYEPLPADVRDDLQAEVGAFYDLFVSTVAKGRSRMTEKAIRDTQARVFMGDEAVKVGLADEVGTFEQTLADLGARNGGSGPMSTRRSNTSMENLGPTPGATLTISQVDFDAKLGEARAAGQAAGHAAGLAEAGSVSEAALAAARQEGHAAGASAERARISGILGMEEATGREASARHLALNTDTTVDAAKGVLAGLTAGPKATSLDARMAGADATVLAPGAAAKEDEDRWGAAFAKAGAGLAHPARG